MICPHCGRTIEEQDHYLMQRVRDLPLIPYAWAAVLLTAIVLIVVALATHPNAL